MSMSPVICGLLVRSNFSSFGGKFVRFISPKIEQFLKTICFNCEFSGKFVRSTDPSIGKLEILSLVIDNGNLEKSKGETMEYGSSIQASTETIATVPKNPKVTLCHSFISFSRVQLNLDRVVSSKGNALSKEYRW